MPDKPIKPAFLSDEQWRTHQKWEEDEKNRPILRPIDTIDWLDEPPPPQEWTVPDRFPRRETVLLSGHGGAGKSTVALHLCAAHVAGKEWLGTLPEPGSAIFVDAEDDHQVIRRRLWHIGKHFGVSGDAFANLHLFSLHGKICNLATVSRLGVLAPSKLFDELLAAARMFTPQTIVLASVANFFPGNENDRVQVTQFIGMMNQLATEGNCSVILISHPSLTGMTSDSGISGSTQWHNAVRARIYLNGVKTNGEEEPNHDLKQLEFRKNQYGPTASTITLKWRDGMFLPEGGPETFNKAVRESQADMEIKTMFITAVSPNKAAPNYAPRIFAQMPQAKKLKLTEHELELAMFRAIHEGSVKIVEEGPPSKRRTRLILNNQ